MGRSLIASKFHFEVLSNRQRRLLSLIAPVLAARNFYLGGGTAIALQLGHRRSLDFDWFTADEFDDLDAVISDLRSAVAGVSIVEIAPRTIHATVSGVKVSMLGYRHPLLKPMERWRDLSLSLASLADLAAMKLSAIVSRGAKRDFVDVYAVAQKSLGLPAMLDCYRKKYQTDDMSHVLYALSHFTEADLERTPKLLWKTNWRSIKLGVSKLVKDVVDSETPHRSRLHR